MKKPRAKTPKTPCALCDGPYADAAQTMEEMGATPEEIATQCGVNVDCVQRHFAECVGFVTEEADGTFAMSDAKLAKLIRDATQTYDTATRQGNLVASSAALSVRLRALCEQNRRLEAREQDAEEKASSEAGTLTVELLDDLIRQGEEERPAKEAAEKLRVEESRRALQEAISQRVAAQKKEATA